ncbi:MAG TPA: FG-GAP-like repeat-containing protein [Woeseiaceae bacterium]|nr:FG-GAP-like repeat-containing protein [Woeseiaceae bacterium]
MKITRARPKSVPAAAGIAVVVTLLGLSAAASASGWPPFAVRDSIAVARGGTVEVLTSGADSVLDNDFDLERDPLTAILAKDVKHGSLLLRGDGTFVYRHDGSQQDDDEFQYRAFDGTGFSREATVSIAIEDVVNSPPFVVRDVPDQVATEGDAYRLVLAGNFADPDEDDRLRFGIDGLPGSGSLQFDPDLGVLAGTPVAADVRQQPYRIEVTATDRQGASASLGFELLVLRRNEPPFVVAPVPDQEAIEGIAYRLNLGANFADPDEGDVLRFSASGLPASGTLQLDAATGLLTGTATRADARDEPYVVEVQAQDRAGATASLTFRLLVLRDNRSDVVLGISPARNPVTVGEGAQWNIDIENKGPADLLDGQLFAGWVTSGQPLSVTAPQGCIVTGNGTSAPTLDCSVGLVTAGTSVTLALQGVQQGAGDNSLIGAVTADDPNPGDNEDLASMAVVAEFSEGPTQIVDASVGVVRTGDLDGDGATDIVATGEQTVVFFNNGNRAVTTPGSSLGADSGGTALALLDWNRDGFPDIAVGGLDGRSLQVFVNDGAGGFVGGASLQGSGVGSVSGLLEADTDGDGSDELLVTGSGGTAILRPGAGGAIDVVALAAGAGRDLAIADFDQDGDQDVVVVLAADRRVELLFNAGDGSIAGSDSLELGSVANVSSGDLNGDGAADLLLAIDGEDMNAPRNRVLYQQGGGAFAPGPSFGASPVTALVPGDVDADGWPDIVAINEAGVHQLYLGSQDGSFSLAPEQIVSAGMQRGVLTDFNSDESLDLIMVGSTAGVLEIHANNGIGRLGLGDRNRPEIELLGEASVNIPAGQEYVDPGATAVDDIDGDISDKIEVIGSINSTVVGTQTITYSVADRAGNSVSITRTVIVGVNEGTGGGGGGAPALLFLAALLGFAGARRAWSKT